MRPKISPFYKYVLLFCSNQISNRESIRLSATEFNLFFFDDNECEASVIDFLGGYGASFLGHNHHRIVSTAQAMLKQKVPFNAQMSVRGYAARLAERLDDKLFHLTNQHYVTTLANSGTEAVEAAIKHAQYAYY